MNLSEKFSTQKLAKTNKNGSFKNGSLRNFSQLIPVVLKNPLLFNLNLPLITL